MSTRHEEAAKAIFGPIEFGVWLTEAQCADLIRLHYRELEDAAVAARDVIEWYSQRASTTAANAALDALNKALGGKP